MGRSHKGHDASLHPEEGCRCGWELVTVCTAQGSKRED